MNKKYNIVFVARDDGGCGFYRCSQPASFLNRTGLANAKSVLQFPSNEDLLLADLVVMQNTGTPEASSVVNFLIANKIPYITEFDDFIFHVSPNNLAGWPAWNPSTLYLNRALEMSRKAVGITVSTNWLAREFFPYNNRIYVIPNYLDKDKWDVPVVKKIDGKVRIGWAGGNAHADDLHMISKVLEKIVAEYKGKVVFETMGMTRHELSGVFNLKITGEVCPSCGYEGEIHHHPGEELQNYPLILASQGWDMAVAPVINNSFGNAKSDLKIKEYSALGIPIVASKVDPYIEASKSNSQLYLAGSFDEWYNNIRYLIDHPEERDKISKGNKDWSEGNWIQDNIYKIFEVYSDIIKSVGDREYRLKHNKQIL